MSSHAAQWRSALCRELLMQWNVEFLTNFRFAKGAPMWEEIQAQIRELEKQIGPEFRTWETLTRPQADAAEAGGMVVVWLKSERGHKVQALGSPETLKAATVLLELSKEKKDDP